jgi:alpha-tubulin suppressor-like RCC1 family protein
LGDGTKTDRSKAVKVVKLNSVKAVAAGDGFTVALRDDGIVWTWGNNTHGQLGDGTTEDRTKPVQVPGLKDVKSVACGRFRTTALKTDGTVWNWGYNWYGELGDGTETHQSSPVQVQSLDSVEALACGPHHTLVIKSDGTVWGWGYGYKGQLGIRGFSGKTGAVQKVAGLSNIKAVAAGWNFSLALAQDGSLWAWGRNWYGQFGVESPRASDVPVRVPGISGIENIVSRAGHTIATKVYKKGSN